VLWGQIFILDFVYISRKLSSYVQVFPLKTKKYLHRFPVDSSLEYIYFMKIGQPKLSERKSQPFDSLACPSTSLRPRGSGLTLHFDKLSVLSLSMEAEIHYSTFKGTGRCSRTGQRSGLLIGATYLQPRYALGIENFG
jgi:hypothetical protein